MARLPPTTSVFTAEMYAIFMCLSFLKHRVGQYIIFTDSYSSISALQNIYSSSHHLAFFIADILANASEGKFRVEWVPGHKGIMGNERADSLAKQSLLLPLRITLSPPYKELRHTLQTHYHHLWQQKWSSSPSRILPIKPLLGISDYLLLPRKQQITITRLRFRTCLFTHQHLFSKTSPPVCTYCNTRLTLPHVLLICPRFDVAREPLRDACQTADLPFCMQTVLSTGVPSIVLITFLKSAGYLGRI
jgi:hypothetical protein